MDAVENLLPMSSHVLSFALRCLVRVGFYTHCGVKHTYSEITAYQKVRLPAPDLARASHVFFNPL